jgi:lipopolysaccharide transport system ATP-binding protein
MSKTVIQVNNISKQYRLGQVSTGTIGHDFNRWWHKIRGKEDPYLQIGEINDRTQKGSTDYVWALENISFDVQQGEVLGIIGRNGAGKSTLLKILSKVTQPTTGDIKVKGRIASLLEVGTGFHPELSGRENIFLNGAILGMTKKEIKNKFDEIVDFAGVERYIDTPVKRYSSGMYVRLAFAVAAHLEPEILIVDEVLAVGDAEFQKKCLGKMKDVSVNGGRTVLFVSHNMGAITTLCNNALLMQFGKVHSYGKTSQILKSYFNLGLNKQEQPKIEDYRAYKIPNTPIQFTSIEVLNVDGFPKINMLNPITIKLGLKCNQKINNGAIQLLFFNSQGVSVDFAYSPDDNFYINLAEAGYYELVFSPRIQQLTPDVYTIGLGLTQSDTSEIWDAIHHYPIFEIENQGQIIQYQERPWAAHHSSNNLWQLNKSNETNH